VLIPEASAGCVCQFSIASTITLEPRAPRRSWTIYSSVGNATPVKHMALNLGAPGDRKDAAGKVWLAYPRPVPGKETGLDLRLQLKEEFIKGGEFTSRTTPSPKRPGNDHAWLYSSWADGLTKCKLPLLGKGDVPARYTLRLHFADVNEQAKPGQRIFDVKVQDKVVLKDFDIVKEAGGPATPLVREITDIAVTDNLTIELLPSRGTPILSAIDVTRIP
jgi:hypothetical protein